MVRIDCGELRLYYKEISETVKYLRIHCGVYDTGTILQEASYIREYSSTVMKKTMM